MYAGKDVVDICEGVLRGRRGLRVLAAASPLAVVVVVPLTLFEEPVSWAAVNSVVTGTPVSFPAALAKYWDTFDPLLTRSKEKPAITTKITATIGT
jgi:hypothetical protein